MFKQAIFLHISSALSYFNGEILKFIKIWIKIIFLCFKKYKILWNLEDILKRDVRKPKGGTTLVCSIHKIQ